MDPNPHITPAAPPAMTLPKSHLAADVELPDIADALAEWSWLLGEGWTPCLVSAAGDVFLIHPAGAIVRLDTGVGEIYPLSPTREAFEQAMMDSDTLSEWFLEPVVNELRQQGKIAERGQCYGFAILPIFKEGSYAAANRFCISAAEHIRVTGNLHRQLRDVAERAAVPTRVSD